MQPAADRPSERPLGVWIVAVALCLIGCWPYLANLGLPPMAADAPVLLARVDPAATDAWDWILDASHFGVTWRPVTMASFALDPGLAGGSVVGLRAVDLALHVAAALATFAVARRLLPGAAALLALALVLAHPLVLEVLPFLPRRSYSLCVLLAAAATRLQLPSERGGPAAELARGTLAALLLTLALGAHEVAGFWIVGAFALRLAWEGRSATGFAPLVRSGLAFVPTAVLGGLFLARRAAILEGAGGYEVAAEGLGVLAVLENLGASLLPLLSPWPLAVAAVLALLPLALLLDSRRDTTGLALLAWLVTAASVLALQGVWFERMAQPLVAPLALAIAWLASTGSPRRASQGVALGFTLATLFVSPLVRGVEPAWRAHREARAGLIEALEGAGRAAAAELGAEAIERGERVTLRLVLPYRSAGERSEAPTVDGARDPEAADAGQEATGRGRAARRLLSRDAIQPVRWVQHVLRDVPVELVPWVWVEEPQAPWTAAPSLDPEGALVLPPERSVLVVRPGTTNPRRRKPEAPRVLPFPGGMGASSRLFLYEGAGGRLVPLP